MVRGTAVVLKTSGLDDAWEEEEGEGKGGRGEGGKGGRGEGGKGGRGEGGKGGRGEGGKGGRGEGGKGGFLLRLPGIPITDG